MVELTAWVAFANMAARSNIAMGLSSRGFSKEGPVPLARQSAGYARLGMRFVLREVFGLR
jgi:hypothetical protein